MHNSKLIDLLKTFEKEDWRWFRKFLLSPYFNSREELVVFCDYLRAQVPDFKERAIRKEKIFKKLYPKETYNEKRISYAMNFLLGQAERFLTQREIEKSNPLLNNYLLKSLVNRQLDKHYKYQFEKANTVLNNYKVNDDGYYLFKFQLAEIGNFYFSSQNLRKHDNQLQYAYDNINKFYFLTVIKYGCEMLSRSRAYKTEYNPYFIDSIIAFLNGLESIEPVISIYLQIYFLLKEENVEENFEKLKKLLDQHRSSLASIDNRNIYGYAINYCIIQYSKNVSPKFYVEQCLEFYLYGIKEGFMLDKGYLAPWDFKNVIKLALNLKKYAFTEEFINNYSKKLEEEYQQDALHFNLADINYRKKNYQEAQLHLVHVQFSDLYYSLGAKTMLLKIYYEINEGETLFALIASFSIYLRRNKKITKETREAYLNFTNILGRIVRSTKYKHPSIIEKINETKRLSNRNWLLEICQKK